MKDDLNTPSRWAYRREYARRSYPPGTRIRLLEMPNDPSPVPAGSCGTVMAVDDAGQLLMQWDNGRSLSLLPGVDSFEVLERPKHRNTPARNPKGEILRKTGRYLLRQGYEVRVFDLIDPNASYCYNPFVYVQDDKDVLQLITNLIQNTTPSHAKSSDPFWEKSETALLQALMLYLLHEAPPSEQNFGMVMEMLESAEVREEDESYQSPLDVLFERLEEACPHGRQSPPATNRHARRLAVHPRRHPAACRGGTPGWAVSGGGGSGGTCRGCGCFRNRSGCRYRAAQRKKAGAAGRPKA